MKKNILITSGEIMNKKPVLYRNARTILNRKNLGFMEKLLCDGITANAGDACAGTCDYCYVEPGMRKLIGPALGSTAHADVVVRRSNALEVLKSQLLDKKGNPRYLDKNDRRVVYCSTTVDCAANLTLALETVKIAKLIFENTYWQLRLLSKFTLLPMVAQSIPEAYHSRLIFGVSTGTLDSRVAQAIEQGTAHIDKRIESLHWLQDNGFRTFAMICPSLPQEDYLKFSRDMAARLRVEKCEHVWAEVINVRGKSFARTINSLLKAGLAHEATQLLRVCGSGSRPDWEDYARSTFEAHAQVMPAEKLHFLQYVTRDSREWWLNRTRLGAVLLGKHATEPRPALTSKQPSLDGFARLRSPAAKSPGMKANVVSTGIS